MEGFGRGDAGRLRGGSRMGWRDDGGAESVGERGGVGMEGLGVGRPFKVVMKTNDLV